MSAIETKKSEFTGHIDGLWNFDNRVIRVDGWCHSPTDEIVGYTLEAGKRKKYIQLYTETKWRDDANEFLNIENVQVGFLVSFVIDPALEAPDDSNELLTSGFRLIVSLKSGATQVMEVVPESVYPLYHFNSEEATLLDCAILADAVCKGIEFPENSDKSSVNVEQVFRYENWVFVSGWCSNTDLNFENSSIVFPDNDSTSKQVLTSRYHREDIQLHSGVSPEGNEFGFTLLIELSGEIPAQATILLKSESSAGGNSDLINPAKILNFDIELPFWPTEYGEFLSNIAVLYVRASNAIAPQTGLRNILNCCFEIEDSIKHLSINNIETELENPLSIVLNMMDGTVDELFTFVASSNLGDNLVDRLYVCIDRPKYDKLFVRAIDKIQYVFNLNISVIIYGVAVTQAKLIRDSNQFVRSSHLIFGSTRSVLELSSVKDISQHEYLPAQVCLRLDTPYADALLDEQGVILPVKLDAINDSSDCLPPFFGSIISQRLISENINSFYSISVVDFLRAVKSLSNGIRLSYATHQYVQYDVLDDLEVMFSLSGKKISYYEYQNKSEFTLSEGIAA